MALSVSGWVTDGDGDLSHILIFALKPFCILLLPPDDDDDSGDDDNDDHLLFSRPHMAQGRIPRCTQALAERNWTFWEKHWICFSALSSISLVSWTNKQTFSQKKSQKLHLLPLSAADHRKTGQYRGRDWKHWNYQKYWNIKRKKEESQNIE